MFDCNEKWLVYLIACNRRIKQYVGQKVDEFGHKWNNKGNARKFERRKYRIQRHLYEHFNLSVHSGFSKEVILIGKTDPTK